MKKRIQYSLVLGNILFAFLVFSSFQTEKELIASISLDKMRVFYLGLDNPITITAGGVSNEGIKVSGQNITIEQRGVGKYIVRGTIAGNAKIKVEVPNKESAIFDFKVKRMPNPTARLGNKDSGHCGKGAFKTQAGVGAWLDNFYGEIRCKVVSFEVTRNPVNADPIKRTNYGGRLSGQALNLIQLAKIGDAYYIDQVKCKCPCDITPRTINSLVFKIR